MFFAPTFKDELGQPVFHNFHLQRDVPKGANPLAARHPDVFPALTAMRVDFDSAAAVNASVDPLVGLHRTEARIRRGERAHPLAVSKNVVRLMLERVAALPRNSVSNAANRHAVGGYLYGKFGRMGLLTHMQPFTAIRPKFGGSPGVSLKTMLLMLVTWQVLSKDAFAALWAVR